MPRIARIVAPGHPYHVTQRGNYRQAVFRNDEDRSQYLSWVNEYSRKFHLSVWAYCLMDNHVHFIVQPREEVSLAKGVQRGPYAVCSIFQQREEASGHLWQGRFYSCLLDEPYHMAAMRYVERNPVRAKMVNRPWQWKWSSAATHIGETDEMVNVIKIKESVGVSMESWRGHIDSDDNTPDVEAIRRHTMTGRPLGRDGFIGELSRKLGRVIRVLQRGRPRKDLIK